MRRTCNSCTVPVSLFLATLSSVRALCRSSPLLVASDSCSSSFFIWLSEDVCDTTQTHQHTLCYTHEPDVTGYLKMNENLSACGLTS